MSDDDRSTQPSWQRLGAFAGAHMLMYCLRCNAMQGREHHAWSRCSCGSTVYRTVTSALIWRPTPYDVTMLQLYKIDPR